MEIGFLNGFGLIGSIVRISIPVGERYVENGRKIKGMFSLVWKKRLVGLRNAGLGEDWHGNNDFSIDFCHVSKILDLNFRVFQVQSILC